MTRVHFNALVIFVSAFSCYSHAALPSHQQIDSWLNSLGADGKFDASKGIDWGVMPGPFYTPELGIGLGAAVVGLYRPSPKDSVSQNSTVTLNTYASSTGAFGLTLDNHTFLAGDRQRFFISGSLNNTPTWYWGSGFSSARDNHRRQQYTDKTFALHPEWLTEFAPNSWLGLGWSLASMHAARIQHKQKHTITDERAGESVFSSGFATSLRYDTRDFIPNPRHGVLAQLGYAHFSPDTGSDSRFERYEAQLRSYFALGNMRELAWETNGAFTQGNVPWNQLPSLGNSHRMRGYYEGRYRDRNTLSTQLEYRQKLNWRHGYVLWAGAGTMASRWHGLTRNPWLPTVGTGYRFTFKPGFNVRLDYGLGKNSSGFYFQAGEAF